MKKEYKKPVADYIDFTCEDDLATTTSDVIDGSLGTGEIPEGTEWE